MSRFLLLASIVIGALLLLVSCNIPVDVPEIKTPDFSLNCPGVTEHFAHVDTVLIVGHRGAPLLEVENTMPSFKRALAEGANALELDFCMTGDGHIVVWHDWNPNDAIALARESGGEAGSRVRPRFPPVGNALRRPMHELTLAQFRENYWFATKNLIDKDRVDAQIPTFDEWIDWAAQQSGLHAVFFDIKVPRDHADLAQSMIGYMDSVVKARNVAWRPVFLTPYPSVWQVIGSIVSNAGLSFDVDLGSGLVSDDYCSIASSSYARQRGHGFATTMHPFVWTESPWATLKNLLLCDLRARDAAIDSNGVQLVEKVIAATIDDPDKIECLLNLGVDGLITNEPRRMRDIALKLGKKL